MAEAALGGNPMAMVDATQLQKDPALEYPGGRGWEEKVQKYVMVQRGAPDLIRRIFKLCCRFGVVGVFCRSGRHRSVAIAEMAADWFRRCRDYYEVCVLHMSSEITPGWSDNMLTKVLAWRGGHNNLNIPRILLEGETQRSSSPAGTNFGPAWCRKIMEDLYLECQAQGDETPPMNRAVNRAVPPEPKKKPRESTPPVPEEPRCEARSSEGSTPAVLERGTKRLRDHEPCCSPEVQLDSSSSSGEESVRDCKEVPPEEVVDFNEEGFWDAAEVMEDLLGNNPSMADVLEMGRSREYWKLCDKLAPRTGSQQGLRARILCTQAQWRLRAGPVAHLGMSASDLQKFMKGPILLLEIQIANGSTHRDALRHYNHAGRERYKAWIQDNPVLMHYEEMEQMYVNYRNYRRKKLETGK